MSEAEALAKDTDQLETGSHDSYFSRTIEKESVGAIWPGKGKLKLALDQDKLNGATSCGHSKNERQDSEQFRSSARSFENSA
jgi:hypothetical protein